MQFDTIRRTLAYAADHLGTQLFETKAYQERVRKALDAADRWHQRECALKAPLVICFVFMMMLHRSTSLAKLVTKLLEQYRLEFPRLSLKAITPEAVCHARERLGSEPLLYFFESLAAVVRPQAGMLGLKFWAMDGVAFNVADTKANEAFFGRPKASRGTAAFPQFKVVSLVDASTRQIGALAILPKGGGERDGAMEILARIPRGDVVLIDRGFAATWLFALIMKQRSHLLARISASWRPRIIKRLGKGDAIVEVRGQVPPEYREYFDGRASVTLRLRLIEYKIETNEKVRLLTDLTDPDTYPAMELAKAYHLRWECELAYDEVKCHLATPAVAGLELVFRSKTPDGVMQELYALFGLYNMIRGLMAEAGRRYEVSPLEISFSDTLHVIREVTARYQSAPHSQRARIYRQMLEDIAACRIDRPRRGRQCQRGVKIKMSNFPLKRKQRKRRPINIERDLKLVGGRR